MRKVRIKASELTDVDVELISLVKRPSSRIPFAIMKSEGGKQMFDLTTLFKSEGPAAPVVTSVLVKGEATPQMLDLLKKEGYTVEKAEKQNGFTVYQQETAYQGDVVAVKLSDTVAITVPVIKGEGSFAEMCAARGFYPSIGIATELLQCELYRAVEKSDSPSAAAGKVSSLVSDFGQFMSQLVGGLPVSVFKTEQLIAKSEEGEAPAEEAPAEAPAEEAAAEEAPAEEAPAEEAAPAAEANELEVSNEVDPEVVEAAPSEPENPIGHTQDLNPTVDSAPPVAEQAAGEQLRPNEEVAAPKAGEPVATHLAKEDVAALLADALKPVLDRLGAVEGGISKAEEALGTPLAGVFGTRGDHVPVEKGDSDNLPLLDSGFSVGNRWNKNG